MNKCIVLNNSIEKFLYKKIKNSNLKMFAAKINKEPTINSLNAFLKSIPFVVKIKIASNKYAEAAIQAGINLNKVESIIKAFSIKVALKKIFEIIKVG